MPEYSVISPFYSSTTAEYVHVGQPVPAAILADQEALKRLLEAGCIVSMEPVKVEGTDEPVTGQSTRRAR